MVRYQLAQLDESGIGGTETTCIEVETLQVVVKVNMKPFTPGPFGLLRCDGEESFPDALPAGTMSHQSVLDERV
jgi:hypothetical protein